MEEKIELRRKARNLMPMINIGKNGLTDSLVKQIETIIKKKKLLKIKINKSALENEDKKEIVRKIIEKTNAELIDFIGFNVVIYKR